MVIRRNPFGIRVVLDGRLLVPPSDLRDCSCTFCSLFRARHLLVRAWAATGAVVLVGLLVAWTDHQVAVQGVTGGTQVVGGLLLVLSAAVVVAVASWYQPARRLGHRVHPRTRAWPPPVRC